jgi:hypothetical protein
MADEKRAIAARRLLAPLVAEVQRLRSASAAWERRMELAAERFRRNRNALKAEAIVRDLASGYDAVSQMLDADFRKTLTAYQREKRRLEEAMAALRQRAHEIARIAAQ